MPHSAEHLEALGMQREELTTKLDANRRDLHAAILAAHHAGVGTVEIARLAHITRDAVRQIINKQKGQNR
jgi:hypothetical protein